MSHREWLNFSVCGDFVLKWPKWFEFSSSLRLWWLAMQNNSSLPGLKFNHILNSIPIKALSKPAFCFSGFFIPISKCYPVRNRTLLTHNESPLLCEWYAVEKYSLFKKSDFFLHVSQGIGIVLLWQRCSGDHTSSCIVQYVRKDLKVFVLCRKSLLNPWHSLS